MPLEGGAEEVYKSQEPERTYEGWRDKKVWLVEATTGVSAMLHPKIPRPGFIHPELAGALVVCKKVYARYKDIDHYLVYVEYDNFFRGRTDYHQIGDVDEGWRLETRTEQALVDLNGLPIGQEGEGTSVLVPHGQYVVTVYLEYQYDVTWALSLIRRVNSEMFKGFDPGKWLCMGAVPERLTAEMMSLQFTFELDTSDSGWQFEWYPFTIEEEEVGGKPVKRKVYSDTPIISPRYLGVDFNQIWP